MTLGPVGIIVLVHQNLIRNAQAIRHWAAAGCAVVVHVDTAVTASDHDHFLQELGDLTTVFFCARHRCE